MVIYLSSCHGSTKHGMILPAAESAVLQIRNLAEASYAQILKNRYHKPIFRFTEFCTE